MGMYLIRIRTRLDADKEIFIVYKLLSAETYTAWKKNMMNVNYPYTWNFGIKQSVTFETFQDFKDTLYIQNLTEEEAKLVGKLLVKSFREWPWPEGLEDE